MWQAVAFSSKTLVFIPIRLSPRVIVSMLQKGNKNSTIKIVLNVFIFSEQFKEHIFYQSQKFINKISR